MTRICMDCAQILGEKCPHCGAEAKHIATRGNGVRMFACTRRGCTSFMFAEGKGGETHGLCAGCVRARHQAWKEATHHGPDDA